MLLYGRPIADKMRSEQTERIKRAGLAPRLAIIQAGNDRASTTYIRMKQRYGRSIGAVVDHIELPGELKPLLEKIQQLNARPKVHGIIVQLPLPDSSITPVVVDAIDPAKDVDGLSGKGPIRSATAGAVLKLLEGYDIQLADRPVTLVGQGRLVGAPLAKLLRRRHARLTVCDETTSDLAAATKAAEVLITAAGVPGLIKTDMVQDGAVIIDVGTGEEAGTLAGDTDSELLANPTLKITPAKGGVGPVTVAMLFEQLLTAAAI